MVYYGSGKVRITPPQGLLGRLHGLRGTLFDNVLDDIYVRVMYFKSQEGRALLIDFDLDKVPNPRKMMECAILESGLSEDEIMLFSIHNHSSPISGYRPHEGPNNIQNKPLPVQEATKEYEQLLENWMVEAVRSATASIQPVRLGISHMDSYLNVHRYVHYEGEPQAGGIEYGLGHDYDGECDRRLWVMKMENLDGVPVGFFINYPMHNVAMIWNQCGNMGNSVISSDIGGNTARYLELHNEGAVAIWSSGAAGDVNPIISNELSYPDPMTGERKEVSAKGNEYPLMILEFLTAQHLAEVMNVIKSIKCNEMDISIKSRIDWLTTQGSKADLLMGDEQYRIRIQTIKMGHICMSGFSGELFSSYARKLRPQSPYDATIFINHNASLLVDSGYIFDEEAFDIAKNKKADIVGMNKTGMMGDKVPAMIDQKMVEIWHEFNDDL